MSTPEALQRRRRATLAQRLIAMAPDAVGALDWDALARAPDWLALPDDALLALQRQVGALLCAAEMRLWIDGARLAAARAALGEPYLRALLAQPAMPSTPLDAAACPRIALPGQVGALLQLAGGSVLLASLTHGPLRRAASAALAPAVASTIARELARSLIARAQSLAAGSAA
ncbi:MAG TPA: hypothetical protein VJ608_05770 [Albitalea sp.]|nr:hypothetical protein [Albitalea sp.]